MAGYPSAVRALVGQIESEIASGELPFGEVLGTEPELCERYGVSPTILRQAARILESSSLAAMRPGNRGGLVVQGYTLNGAAKALATYLEFTGATRQDVQMVSALTLTLSARAAAAAMSLRHADTLRAELRRLSLLPTAFQRGAAFIELFQQVIETTGNPLLAFSHRVATHFQFDVTAFDRVSLKDFDRATDRASELLEAMVAGEVQAIDTAMQGWIAINRRAIELNASEQAARQRQAAPGVSYRTRSEQLARQILAEIREANWPVGRRLGSECELLRRYEVSRATFRQAVRLLEQYFAVTSRRGPQGGLFVTSPDPRRIETLATSTLLQKRIARRHLTAVAPFLSVLALELATARDRPGLAALLRELVSGALPEPATKLRRLHLGIAELSGNAFLSALIRIAITLEPQIEPLSPATDPPVIDLLEQAESSLRAGDVARLKRAVAELIALFGFGGNHPEAPIDAATPKKDLPDT